METTMIEVTLQLIQVMGETFLKILPETIALALIFTVLNHFWACNPGPPWWQKRELATDILYWFLIPTLARVVRIGSLVIGAALDFNVTGEAELIAFYDDGHGPLAQLPLWAQAVLFMVLSDFGMYW